MSVLPFVIKKEFLQLRRDRRMLPIVLIAPVLQLVLLGYAANLDVQHLPTVVFDQDDSRLSRELVADFLASGYFDLALRAGDLREVEGTLLSSRASVALVIPNDFGRAILRGDPVQLQLLVDGADSTIGTAALNYARGIVTAWATGLAPPGPGRQPPIQISAQVWYLALDEKRQEIGWIGVEREGAPMTVYFDPLRAQEVTPERIEKEKRLMDCVDCHNRATHIFRSPEELIDRAIQQKKIDASLPYIKNQGTEALVPVNGSLEGAYNKIASIAQFYRESYPEVYAQKLDTLAYSLEELRKIARLTTFPEQGVTWETHIDNIGHTKGAGCLRCHGKLVNTGTGQKIDASCNLCHDMAP